MCYFEPESVSFRILELRMSRWTRLIPVGCSFQSYHLCVFRDIAEMAESAELPVEELKIEEEDENSQYKVRIRSHNLYDIQVAAKVSTTDILEKDKDDESLNKWKAQLLADAQAAKSKCPGRCRWRIPFKTWRHHAQFWNTLAHYLADDPRKVVIREMALMCDGREPIVFDLSTAVRVEILDMIMV